MGMRGRVGPPRAFVTVGRSEADCAHDRLPMRMHTTRLPPCHDAGMIAASAAVRERDELTESVCFALAAGYGGRTHGVEPMPELLVGGLDVRGNALEQMALEALKDGCLHT